MKSFEENNVSLVDLSQDEMMNTQGGESIFYWVAYGAGTAYHYLKIASSMDESIPLG